MSSVAPSPGEVISRVPSTFGGGLSNVSATTGTRGPGSRSRVDAVDGSFSPTVVSAASNSIGSRAGPSGGMRSVLSARGSRASLIGRLHFGSGLAPDDDVGTNITYPIRGDPIQEKTCRSSAGRRTFENRATGLGWVTLREYRSSNSAEGRSPTARCTFGSRWTSRAREANLSASKKPASRPVSLRRSSRGPDPCRTPY